MHKITVHLEDHTKHELDNWLSKTAFALEPRNPKRHLDADEAIQAMIHVMVNHSGCGGAVESHLRHKRGR